jgi:hypothetical protein
LPWLTCGRNLPQRFRLYGPTSRFKYRTCVLKILIAKLKKKRIHLTTD